MSVIGRLDEQTDALLIKPLEKGSGRKPGPAAPPEPAHDRADAPSHAKRRTPGDDESSSDGSTRRDELPVWLL